MTNNKLAFHFTKPGIYSQFKTRTQLATINLKLATFQTNDITCHTKIISISICDPTIPITWHAKYPMFGNYRWCFAHQMKGLKASTCTTILLKNENSTLRSSKVVSLRKVRFQNTPSSNILDVAKLTMIKVMVRRL